MYGTKPAFSMAIESDTLKVDYYPDQQKLHHRNRRAIVDVHPLKVSAIPYLSTSYYFNRNEAITFQIRLEYNNTGYSGDITDIRVEITSEWLDLSKGSTVQGDFSDAIDGTSNAPIFNHAKLQANANPVVGNVTGIVKPGVGPLSSLTLKLKVNATYDSNEIYVSDGVSSPTVYAVFPEINITRSVTKEMAVYEEFTMNMNIVLPVLNYTLLVELTTNIEDYVFMELQSIQKTTGAAINFNGTGDIKQYSSLENSEMDRVEIDFGYITIPETGTTKADRTIDINFKVVINDHEEVANGSTHYMGAGIQAGPSVLWVEQHDVEIIKENQPALNYTVTSEQTLNDTRLYIGDHVKFDFDIEHASTSSAIADEIRIGILTDGNLKPIADTGQTNVAAMGSSNSTYTEFRITDMVNDKLTQGNSKQCSILMEVSDTITPLSELQAKFYLMYKKTAKPKRAIVKSVDGLRTATPLIRFSINNQNDTITPGNKVDYTLSIVLTKMNSPLQIELVLPKAGGKPIMTILSFEVVHKGANIRGINANNKPVYRSTTNITGMYDQAVLDLGTGTNTNVDTSDSPDNQLTLTFRAILNDYANVTNSSSYWVGAGVIGKPKMVWVGQIKMKTYIKENCKPLMNIGMNIIGDGDEYEYAININHTEESCEFAHNMTFEYYLPLYVEYVEETTTSDDIVRVGNTGLRFRYNPEVFYFTKSFNHSIKVKINRDKSSKTGKFNFVVPLRLHYYNKNGTSWEYFRAVNRSLEVLPRTPTIPKDSRAKDHYYGRGFYWNSKNDKDFYVCMNQHVMTATTACYKLHSDGIHFTAIDRRLGCILGHHNNVLYGLARNQITAMKYVNDLNEWYPIQDLDLPAKSNFVMMKDLTDTKTIGVTGTPDANHELTNGSGDKWQGTGDGLYFKKNGEVEWKARAKWYI